MKINNEKEFEEQINKDLLTLVDFYATWCGPCGMQAEILTKLQNSRDDNLNIVKVNVDENVSLASQYNIDSIPTLMFFRNGKLLKTKVGVTSENEILEIMAKFRE